MCIDQAFKIKKVVHDFAPQDLQDTEESFVTIILRNIFEFLTVFYMCMK